MRILFHAVNRVGLGHVVRLAWIARAVARAAPDVVQAMVTSCAFAPQYFSGETCLIPCDLLDSDGHEEQFRSHVANLQPDVIVCDTRWPASLIDHHPSPRRRRILVLRALSPERMCITAERAAGLFDAILLPHSVDELSYLYARTPDLVASFSKPPFTAVGPLARQATRPAAESTIFFSMGAGAPYVTAIEATDDVQTQIDTFVRAAQVLIAAKVRNVRFIAGPYMNGKTFGSIEPVRTAAAHELLGPLSSVVSRGGYNTCWEAIGAGSDLVVTSTHTRVEDVHARCQYLHARGFAKLVAPDPQSIAEAVLQRHAPNVTSGALTVNQGLNAVVRAIVG